MDERDVIQLIARYHNWRRIYRYADGEVPNEPDWVDGRLYFRNGYPYPGWSAFILEATSDRKYRVLHTSTERRNTSVESSRATFSRLQDAGKYIIYDVADALRVRLGLKPLEQKWRATGLDPRVDKIAISEKQAKYLLRSDEKVYFLAYSGGVQPYNHILSLSYDQLDTVLRDGFPKNVIRPLSIGGDAPPSKPNKPEELN
ncbi:hypothetical protein MSIMFB_03268 [Mycobacterium simulans]|uniref:Uncharacterized protein n=2 Tax=Mycobacterium simulans TaxID=627089 RepID=A0A7Z7ILG5_9MYCO|nr:hypothetical protein MSIMFB_03268 [Mycobacterium simulans]